MKITELSYEEKRAEVEKQFNDFINQSPALQSEKSLLKIKKAFKMADDAHSGQFRKTGLKLPYITHPIAVAKILTTEMGFGETTAIAALLHDVIEDSNGKYSLENIEKEFGKEVAVIVDGVTKIMEGFNPDSTVQVETFKKFINNMAIDKRTAFVKIADRLHNFRTFDGMRENSQMIKTAEVYDIYAPLAHLLGLFEIKKEIEDLSFIYRQPVEYTKTKNKADKTKEQRLCYLNELIKKIKDYIPQNKLKIRYEITERSLYRAWKISKTKKISFNDIHNFNSVRIIIQPMKSYSEKQLCYTIYSYLTDIFPVKQSKLKDWITNPKSNGFQALIADVMHNEKWAEVQIMTERMNRVAKTGYAQGYPNEHTENIYRWVNSVNNIIENKELSNEEVMELIRPQAQEINVLSPKGKIIKLPKNATVLDFAFHIHTDLGIRFKGAEVNGKLVGYNHKLDNADQVQIFSSENSEPQTEWIDSLSAPQSKAVLRQYFQKKNRKISQEGENNFQIISDKYKVTEKELNKLFIKFNCLNKDEFYYRIANETITVKEIISAIRSFRGIFSRMSELWSSDKVEVPFELDFNPKEKFVVKNLQNIVLAECCQPVDGDTAIVYRKNDNEIVLHRNECETAKRLNASDGNNTAKVIWDLTEEQNYLSTIKFNGVDNPGLLSEIINLISYEHKINMKALKIETDKNSFFGTIDILVPNVDELNNILKEIRKIKFIRKVYRKSKLKTDS
jgi:GTP pyrophosphokinase